MAVLGSRFTNDAESFVDADACGAGECAWRCFESFNRCSLKGLA